MSNITNDPRLTELDQIQAAIRKALDANNMALVKELSIKSKALFNEIYTIKAL